jgi:EAL domain-containing protein (putative c-di-GMP-specific phosphodiesterase class I)
VPRACVLDHKPHIRRFLAEAIEDIGFITDERGHVSELKEALSSVDPDLIVLGLLQPESDVTATLHALAAHHYTGKIMLFGGRAAMAVVALHDLGERLGLAMLPPLRTPFRDSDLHENLAVFLPIPASPSFPVDVDQALRNGWLELWYQPIVDLRHHTLYGAEALVRMRHPTWGTVPPACFLPSREDPALRALSEFVIGRAMSDWAHLLNDRSSLQLAVNLPMTALQDSEFVERMCLHLPDHAVAVGLTVDVESVQVGRDLPGAQEIATQLKTYNVGTAIDDVVSADAWAGLTDFAFTEIKVDRRLIDGCTDDPRKRAACRSILASAKRLGARTVAEGIANSADCQTARDLGFELGQGYLFARPMELRKFMRTVVRAGQRPSK